MSVLAMLEVFRDTHRSYQHIPLKLLKSGTLKKEEKFYLFPIDPLDLKFQI